MTRNPDDPKVIAEQYRRMVWTHGDTCWRCGRTSRDKPDWWGAVWCIQRAHVVSKPRVEDVRVCILLCPICHSVQHGYRFPQLPNARALTLPEMLWLKKHYDPANYDRKFIGRYSVSRLPCGRIRSPERLRDGLGLTR